MDNRKDNGDPEVVEAARSRNIPWDNNLWVLGFGQSEALHHGEDHWEDVQLHQ